MASCFQAAEQNTGLPSPRPLGHLSAETERRAAASSRTVRAPTATAGKRQRRLLSPGEEHNAVDTSERHRQNPVRPAPSLRTLAASDHLLSPVLATHRSTVTD